MPVRTAPRVGSEEALRRVVEATSAVTGREFFRGLTRQLAAVFNFRYALVGELVSPWPARVQTLAVWDAEHPQPRDRKGVQGNFLDDFDYVVAATPSEYVVGRKPAHYPQAVRQLFPEDAVLARLGAESFLGVPLFDSTGRGVGLIALLGDRPSSLEDTPQAQAVLRIFAPRAAAELERMRKESALRETGQRYQALAETSPVGIFHTDSEGNCTYVNARYCQITGMRAEEAFGDGWASRLHPADRDRVVADWRSQSAPFHEEYRFVHPDGRVVWVVGQVVPLRGERDGPVTGYLGTITDITETKRAEEELRRSEQRYQALAEGSAVGIWQVTPAGATLYINPTMRAMLELAPEEELSGVSFYDFFTPESLGTMRAEHVKRAEGTGSSYEVELVGRGGTRRNVVISGAPLVGAGGDIESLIGTFTDITDRRRAEEALRASERSLRENEARLRMLVEQVPTILWTIDTEMRFTSATGAGLSALGLKPSDTSGLPLREFFGDDPSLPAIPAHRRALEGSPSTYEQDWNGHTFQAHVEPLRGPDGAITGAIGVAADITERKRAEEVLRESRDELEARVRQRTRELTEANRALQHEVLERRLAEEALRHSELSLRQSEQRYASILNTQQTLVSRSDTAGRITYVNAAHSRTFGSKIGDSLFVKVHPDDVGPTSVAMEALARPPYTCTLEQRCEVAGEWRTFLWQVGVIRDEEGRIIEYQGVGFDITDRRRAEEALREAAHQAREAAEFNRRLVLEVDHRVRNNLAGLLSLVSAMRAAARDVDGFAGAIEGRLLAMTHVHQLLADTGWRAVDLRTLVRTLLKAVERLGPHAATTEVDGPDVPASPRQALPLSMILLEWFTNSGKYGAHSSPTGRVRVTWEVFPGANGNGANGNGDAAPKRWVRLHWRESGGPPVRDAAPATSLGTELVKGFTSLELRGRYEARYPAGGAEYVLEFPVQGVEQEPLGIGSDYRDRAAAPLPAPPPVTAPTVVTTTWQVVPEEAPAPEPAPEPPAARIRIRPSRRRR